MGYIHVILGIVMDSIFFEAGEGAIEPELSTRMLFYINENFRGELSLDALATHFGYTNGYISRYFSACFGVGFSEYLTTLRLKNALVLMNEHRHSVTECAFESGFNSTRTFYRVFRNEFGCSPGEYLAGLKARSSLEKSEERR